MYYLFKLIGLNLINLVVYITLCTVLGFNAVDGLGKYLIVSCVIFAALIAVDD
ncbi:hypothetical protein N4T77_02840 [Clostridium sp. CX1]|uniref:hypothetical protein n=1 Tax=Clostridium sp. CX1 TaxID=2978346 RepID=UPI0021BEB41D|nr:hypothetical protein [Clostridium sp. CX1]MCT8975528.1 hypothetical protein [Clostridium sp. CX1]